MGVSFGSLTKILLGVGLGILAVSCLTVTVLFGQFANKTYSNLEKAKMKTEKSNKKSSLDASIAITVLGCISAVAAIAALALSILLEGQTIILIIVGGVSALFAFGCIVAEGVFTKLQIEDDVRNMGNVFDSSSDAQKYIAGAIEDLYTYAHQFLSKDNSNIPTWTKVKNEILGTKSESNQIITYSNIWKGENSYESSEYITLGYRKIVDHYYPKTDYGYIVAKFSGLSEVIIASTKFTHKGKLALKRRYCWLKNNNKDFSCKNLEVAKGDNEPVTISAGFYDITDPYSEYQGKNYLTMSEYVVTPQGYITKKKAEDENIQVDYEVDDFPIAYKKLDPTKINDEDLDDEDFGYENSDNEYKVNGETLAKAYFKDVKKAYANPDKNSLIIVPKEPKNIKEVESMCDNEDDCEPASLYGIYKMIDKYYDDSNKGKIPPSVKKSQRNIQRSLLNSVVESDYSRFNILYTIAIINLIIQIIGILFWAGGIFFGLKSNGSGDKTASEGEA